MKRATDLFRLLGSFVAITAANDLVVALGQRVLLGWSLVALSGSSFLRALCLDMSVCGGTTIP